MLVSPGLALSMKVRKGDAMFPDTPDEGALSVPTEEFDQVMNVNVKGVFFSYKYAAMQLIKQGHGGRIVGAASVASKKGRLAHTSYILRYLTKSSTDVVVYRRCRMGCL